MWPRLSFIWRVLHWQVWSETQPCWTCSFQSWNLLCSRVAIYNRCHWLLTQQPPQFLLFFLEEETLILLRCPHVAKINLTRFNSIMITHTSQWLVYGWVCNTSPPSEKWKICWKASRKAILSLNKRNRAKVSCCGHCRYGYWHYGSLGKLSCGLQSRINSGAAIAWVWLLRE